VAEQLGQGNHVVVFGYSQSATVATVYEDYLATLPPDARPSPDQLSFVLIGDPDNPDGGLLERIAGVYVPALGVQGYGATPDDLYPSVIYTLQYDGFADFPQYPIDIPADLNADLGMLLVHPTYPDLTAEQVGAGVVEPVTPADTDTTYILIPSQNLPLLEPLQGVVPAPLLDLIEPPLRDIINLGYDPTAPANVPTPATLFPLDNPITVVVDFLRSIGQGVNDALAAQGLPALPSLPDVPIVSTLMNSLTATSTFTPPSLTLDVPPQIGELIEGPLRGLDSLVAGAVDDHLDPAIQSIVFGIGSALTTVATDVDAPAAITNAVYVGEQLSTFELEIPGLFVTNVTQDLVTAVEDLAIGDISGFGQELQTIGADSIIMDNFAAAFAIEALQAIATGVPLGI
ncbi:PE-PPE domain-containing protein, partial [Mycobacterium sp.]|uniref:PE-PPE domain-containing protein n=1 Tax=Mycobacterium sp. TaxID=1785 RepID=UPI00126C76F5